MDASTSAHTLDDAIVTNDGPLYYPPATESSTLPQEISPAEPRLLRDRIYVGNLHPSVDEHALVQVFSKFGKITKLDFLFHKAGPLKGKPRGYAFIEYANEDDALKAMAVAHEKPLRGRKLVVTLAHQAPLDQHPLSTSFLGKKRAVMETGRPTTLSLIKSTTTTRHGHEKNTRDKIAMMEAKLRQMESSNPKSSTAETTSSEKSTASSLPAPHPSLPVKPPPPLPDHLQPSLPKKPAPIVSTPAQRVIVASRSRTPPSVSSTAKPAPQTQRTLKPKLLGVKIKPKEKAKDKDKDVE